MPDDARDVVALSFLRWLYDQDVDRQRRYRGYREYYDGEHSTQLSSRQREFLQLKFGEDFRDNYCPLVVDALTERLIVTGFEAEAQSADLWDWWQANRMDAMQRDVHLAAVRDGDAFVLVEWDNDAGRPRFSMELGYDGSDGLKIHYGDERGVPSFASKRWAITDVSESGVGYRVRLNLYYPDRIERYIADGRESRDWQRYEEEEDGGWPVWWTTTGTEAGEPLGLPVVHFKYSAAGYNFGRSRLSDVVPIQNALNKAMIDLIAAADAHGFPILTATGTEVSGNNWGPGAVLQTQKADARFGTLPPADLAKMIAVNTYYAREIAIVSNTPLSRLQMSGQVAAEGTLKQQEAGLVADAEATQVAFGNAWEDALALGRKLYNVYSEGGMDETQLIDTQWRPAATRDEMELAKRYALWVADLWVSHIVVWKRLGLTDDEIAMNLESAEYQARLAGQRAMMLLDDEEAG